MGPTDLDAGAARAEEERRQARVDAALQAGWAFQYDPLRDEYTAAREMHTARTLGALLDLIGAAGDG